jgi:hypothetical protein
MQPHRNRAVLVAARAEGYQDVDPVPFPAGEPEGLSGGESGE